MRWLSWGVLVPANSYLFLFSVAVYELHCIVGFLCIVYSFFVYCIVLYYYIIYCIPQNVIFLFKWPIFLFMSPIFLVSYHNTFHLNNTLLNAQNLQSCIVVLQHD